MLNSGDDLLIFRQNGKDFHMTVSSYISEFSSLYVEFTTSAIYVLRFQCQSGNGHYMFKNFSQ